MYAYSFVERVDTDHWTVMIKDGPYKEVCYQYGKVSITESEDKTSAKLSFKYKIVENPTGFDLMADVDFNNAIGDILSDIILESSEKNDYTIGERPNASTDSNNGSEKPSK